MSFPLLPFDEWLDNVALGALSTRDTVKSSYDIARWAIANGIPGDFVECGVFGGAQCAAMARAIIDEAATRGMHPVLGTKRRVHLFDTFTGIPEPGEHDSEIEPHMAEAFTRETCCSLADCQEHMRGWGLPDELFVWHPGLFADTLPDFAMNARLSRIAILRLDGDLYESTKVCLEHLYPFLSPGGWCIIDDFGLAGARKAVIEYMHGQSVVMQWRKQCW